MEWGNVYELNIMCAFDTDFFEEHKMEMNTQEKGTIGVLLKRNEIAVEHPHR